jgi:hypothetical protein
VYNGAAQPLTDTYADYQQQWTVNPATGADWTWDDITALEAGVSLAGQNAGKPAYCTRVWVEVEYAP